MASKAEQITGLAGNVHCARVRSERSYQRGSVKDRFETSEPRPGRTGCGWKRGIQFRNTGMMQRLRRHSVMRGRRTDDHTFEPTERQFAIGPKLSVPERSGSFQALRFRDSAKWVRVSLNDRYGQNRIRQASKPRSLSANLVCWPEGRGGLGLNGT